MFFGRRSSGLSALSELAKAISVGVCDAQHYGIQAYDGERTISLEDQQAQVARHLVSFLKRVRKRG